MYLQTQQYLFYDKRFISFVEPIINDIKWDVLEQDKSSDIEQQSNNTT